MATRKKPATATKERASISRERSLALMLRAIIDSEVDNNDKEVHEAIVSDALKVLSKFGYGDLVSIPRQTRILEAQLATAVTDRDYPAIARLGQQLEQVKLGKRLKVAVAPIAKKPSSRKNGQAVSTVNTGVEAENATNASETTGDN